MATRPVVVHVTGDTGLYGGKDRVLLWLLVKLQRLGLAHTRVVCFRDGLVSRTYSSWGIPVQVLPMSFQFDVRAVWRLARLLRGWGAQIVHTHDHKSHVVGRLAAKAVGVKVVSSLHGLMRDALEMPWVKRVVYGSMVHATDHFTDWWIVVARHLAGYVRGNVTHVPNGVDREFVCQGEDHSLPREVGPVVLCVGRLSPEKGQDVLICAFHQVRQRVPSAVLWLAGQGPLETSLRDQVGRLGLAESVRFLGFRQHVGPLMRRAQVVALPSRGEGLPIAALEAMSMGVPVVAAAVGGVPELISSPDVGVLVPPEAPDALADALVRLLTDPARARLVGQAGRTHVSAHFSADDMARRTAEVYGRVLGR